MSTHIDYQFTSYWGFIIAGAVVTVMVVYLLRKPSLDRSVLEQWASSKRFEILHFERCFFCGGFRWWTTSQKQIVFFVTVRDNAGHERSCWVRFGYFMGGGYSTKEPDIIWNEQTTNAA
jgi:hypothetical protein